MSIRVKTEYKILCLSMVYGLWSLIYVKGDSRWAVSIRVKNEHKILCLSMVHGHEYMYREMHGGQ